MKLSALPIALAALAAAPAAQSPTQVVVPGSAATVDANSSRAVEGLGTAGRQQLLIGASHLQALVGRQLTAITFRRDTGRDRAVEAGDADLVVRIGSAAQPVHAPSNDFTANATAPIEVFRGRVHLPAAPATQGSVGWVAPHVVEIPFQTPWSYAGGDLCIDIEGAPVGTTFVDWIPDGVGDATEGSVTVIGQACGPHAQSGRSAGVAERGLVPGQTATFQVFGDVGSFAALALGAAPRANPIDLAFLGAPGCALHVDPLAVESTVTADTGMAGFPGIARIDVPLPRDAGMLGAAFAAQWVEFGASLRTSEAFDCRLAAGWAPLGVSVVWQVAGGAAEVSSNRVPVIRIRAD